MQLMAMLVVAAALLYFIGDRLLERGEWEPVRSEVTTP
jgi:hypothetical protein